MSDPSRVPFQVSVRSAERRMRTKLKGKGLHRACQSSCQWNRISRSIAQVPNWRTNVLDHQRTHLGKGKIRVWAACATILAFVIQRPPSSARLAPILCSELHAKMELSRIPTQQSPAPLHARSPKTSQSFSSHFPPLSNCSPLSWRPLASSDQLLVSCRDAV